jgi:hypothetical protein
MSRIADKNLVSGSGWVSDDSSFYGESRLSLRSLDSPLPILARLHRFRSYFVEHITLSLSLSPLYHVESNRTSGSETEQEHNESRCDSFELGDFSSAHSRDLNTIATSARIQQQKTVVPTSGDKKSADMMPLSSSTLANKAPAFSSFDRKGMEEERLARLGKRKRDAEDEPVKQLELFNVFEGDPHAWQIGESVDDFVKRVPPATTSAFTCSWIWVSNPHRSPRDKSAGPRIADFTERGSELMSQSLKIRHDIQAKGRFGSKSTLARALNQEGKTLQQRLSGLAKETNVIAGKVPSFELIIRSSAHL